MTSSIDDIKEEEQDIFDDLSNYDLTSLNDVSIGELYPAGESAQVVSCTAKNQARKQLAVSEDSPFSHIGHIDETGQLRKLKEERAAKLREETDEIRRQLDLVKNRLDELKASKSTRGRGITKHRFDKSQKIEARKESAGYKQPDAIPVGPHRFHEATIEASRTPIAATRSIKQSAPKFRPLTGKADCPNCSCDRRSSVCDQCISMAIIKPTIGKSRLAAASQLVLNEPKKVIHHDDRPIRGIRESTVDQVETVDDAIVPNRVYTISRSLNDKRTKLAQAIDELHLMMDQVREKGNKLEEERKLVQLYKDQWKFGPTIGGPIASSRDRLNTDKKQLQQQRRSYESRLDPNLTRDTKSLMGFQHVGASMRLRNYNDTTKQPIGRKPIVATRANPLMHSRSKSLESLKIGAKSSGNVNRGISEQKSASTSKSSVDISQNKTVKSNNHDEELEEVSEELEEEVCDNSDEKTSDDRHPSRVSPPIEVAAESGLVDGNKTLADKVQRMTWIPVFGETEIKTVRRDLPKRKIQIVTPDSSLSKRQSNTGRRLPTRNNTSLKSVHAPGLSRPELTGESLNSKTIMKSPSNNSNSRIMVEAQRKLDTFSNLLEREQQDAVSKNQIIVNKQVIRPTPKPRQQVPRLSPSRTSNNQRDSAQAGESDVQKSQSKTDTIDSGKEIARLEEMVNEQQRLLARLAQAQERPLVSPITVSCSSPCCHHHSAHTSKVSSVSPAHRIISNPGNNKTLINTLRDRLNKSKLRLARILEEEREKHQQLKQKVDSSLRKQSDLENENELLKQSLSRCIDTCLKDISNTFESLSDTLTDSISPTTYGKSGEVEHLQIDETSGVGLTNAAKLIADNRHLKQMRSHIETIERQRKAIFDELNKEKQKSNQLELQLKDSRMELDQLIGTKRQLESRLAMVADEPSSSTSLQNCEQPVDQHNDIQKTTTNSEQVIGSKQSTLNNLSSQTETSDRSDQDDTYNNVHVYRRYIQSMSPDLDSLKREREVILNEFDNIKKMLSDIDMDK